MATNIKTDELDQFHQYNVYTPARLIYLTGEINEDTTAEFIKNIRLMDHVTDKDITVLINSEGGEVQAGMAIYDAIRECHSKVITHTVGVCHSMAGVIFQAGDVRLMSPNATLMVHEGSDGFGPDHPKNIERWVKESIRISKITDDILFKRIKQKKPRYKKSDFQNLLLFDTIYTAKETIEMGLADKLTEHKEFL